MNLTALIDSNITNQHGIRTKAEVEKVAVTQSVTINKKNGIRLQPDVELLLAAAEALNRYLDSVGDLSLELHAQKRRVMAKMFEGCDSALE